MSPSRKAAILSCWITAPDRSSIIASLSCLATPGGSPCPSLCWEGSANFIVASSLARSSRSCAADA
eukprot:10173753-Heterocapsa_arctica.AAC.1